MKEKPDLGVEDASIFTLTAASMGVDGSARDILGESVYRQLMNRFVRTMAFSMNYIMAHVASNADGLRYIVIFTGDKQDDPIFGVTANMDTDLIMDALKRAEQSVGDVFIQMKDEAIKDGDIKEQ